MTDFSEKATQLSSPQGAGSNPLAPVQEGAGNMPIPGFVKEIGDIFAKGLKDSRKEEADKAKNAVLASYSGKLSAINDAIVSGQMKPAEASARRRAVNNEYAAGHSGMIKEISEVHKFMSGETELSEAEQAVQTEKKRREADVSQAQGLGYTFFKGMSEEAENDTLNAAKASVRSQKQMEEFYKQQEFKRQNHQFMDQVAAKEEKEMGVRLVNEIAGSHLQSFQSFSVSLGDQMRTGKIAPEMAQAMLSERFMNIEAGLVSAARMNPELAAPYRSIFKEMNDVSKKMIDPKAANEDLKGQLEAITTRMKLVAMSDPKIAATVVANQLLPNNPSLALASSAEGIRAITIMSANPADTKQFIPQVVGNPDVEPETLKLLKAGIVNIKSGKVGDKEIATLQASNSANHILKQVSKYVDEGVDPASLKGLAGFFAGPEYAHLVTSGKLDKDSALAAKKVFQTTLEPVLINGVQKKMAGNLFDPDAKNPNWKPTAVADAVDIKFSGTGITFDIKPKSGMMDIELRKQQEAVKGLQTSQAAVNQIIRMGAHLEGETNYAKYWEDHKHEIMPGYFLKGLKPGDVRSGYKFNGGNASNPQNYTMVAAEGSSSKKTEASTSPDYGKREDGTSKGKGFLGELKRPDGNISTEISVGVEFDGKQVEIPTLVPTLTKTEIDYLLNGGRPTDAIVDKAAKHAKERMKKGLSPFND